MGNDYIQTPHLDELAKQGILFTHSCVVTSVCMQSRATLYTGQYSSRHKTYQVFNNITMYQPDRWNKTLYTTMKRHGYFVGFYGKWHHKYDSKVLGNYSTFSHYRFYDGDHIIKRGNVSTHITKLNEQDALEFLEKRPKSRPFFLTVSFFATHAIDNSKEQYIPQNSSLDLYSNDPVPIPKTMSEKHWKDLPYFFNDENLARTRFFQRYNTSDMYQHHMKNTLRMATEVDTACGNILAKLKQQNILNNTLVIFTSDNGNFHGQHGLAEKWYPFEESLRVPLIVKDPRMPHNKVGTKNAEFVLNIDLASTILSAAEIPVPSVMQGDDFAQLYLNTTMTKWREDFIYEFRDGNPYILNNMALVQKDFKYISWLDYNYSQLFNMKEDGAEENDISNQTNKQSLLLKMQSRMKALEISII